MKTNNTGAHQHACSILLHCNERFPVPVQAMGQQALAEPVSLWTLDDFIRSSGSRMSRSQPPSEVRVPECCVKERLLLWRLHKPV